MKTLEPRDTYDLIGHKQNKQFILKAWEKDKILTLFFCLAREELEKQLLRSGPTRFLLNNGSIDQNNQNG